MENVATLSQNYAKELLSKNIYKRKKLLEKMKLWVFSEN